MGETYSIICKKCGDHMCVSIGGGRHLPTKEDVEEGGWCESIQEAIYLHPDWIPTYRYRPYLCKCGYITGRKQMALFGESGKITFVDNVCPDCGKKMKPISERRLHMLFEGPYELRARCRKCGGPLEINPNCLWD